MQAGLRVQAPGLEDVNSFLKTLSFELRLTTYLTQRIMNNFREALEEVLEAKKSGSGFHFVQKAQKLGQTAHQARYLPNLLKTPIQHWKKTLSDTRYVLDELDAMGISGTLIKRHRGK